MLKNKRGQIAIFIIIAIVIVVGIVITILILTGGKKTILPEKQLKFSEDYIEECLQQNLEEGVNITSLNGGMLYPSPSVSLYDNTNVLLLCTTSIAYEPCVLQQGLASTIPNSILTYMSYDEKIPIKRTEECIKKAKELFTKEGYTVTTCLDEGREPNYAVTLLYDRIKFETECKFSYSKADDSKEKSKFRIEVIHPIKTFMLLAEEAVVNENEGSDKICSALSTTNINVECLPGNNLKYYVMTDKQNEKNKFRFAMNSYFTV